MLHVNVIDEGGNLFTNTLFAITMDADVPDNRWMTRDDGLDARYGGPAIPVAFTLQACDSIFYPWFSKIWHSSGF